MPSGATGSLLPVGSVGGTALHSRVLYTPPMKRWTLAIVIGSAALGGCAWEGDGPDEIAAQPQALTAPPPPQDLPQVPAPTAAPSQPVVTTNAPTNAAASTSAASVPPVDLPPLPNVAEAPPDFTFSVSVISPLGVRTRGLSAPQRPARYVMDADNALRAWVGSQLPKREWTRVGGPDRALPGRTRQLSTTQVAKIWALMLQAGVVGQDNSQEPSSPSLYAPPKDTLAYVISYSADGDRGWAILDGTTAPTAQAEALIVELSRLAFQE